MIKSGGFAEPSYLSSDPGSSTYWLHDLGLCFLICKTGVIILGLWGDLEA